MNRGNRIHLGYLDGLRALAAIYVVLHHIRAYALGDGLPGWGRTATLWMAFGHFSVSLFIVLSGYCLMLPVVRSPDRNLRGGVAGFIGRRARRILSTYYAALALAVGLIWVGWIPGVIGTNDLWAHILLVHNLFPAYYFGFNGPFWSVATEWQIYFVFALVLLPLWRRFGNLTVLLVAFGLGILPPLIWRGWDVWACYWFIGLFALGMAAATINFGSDERYHRLEKRLSWLPLAMVFTAIALLLCAWKGVRAPGWLLMEDVAAGAATACLLIACTSRLRSRDQISEMAGPEKPDTTSHVLRLLSWEPLIKIGAFSYSLYLTHGLVLTVARSVLSRMGIGTIPQLLIQVAVTVPCTILFAYLFSLCFERPFLSK
ncbi:MAG: acyltransferase [Chthonomonadaceae bacterium]|nr:acyltransferase [Chthonomonadaceae bacterium]